MLNKKMLLSARQWAAALAWLLLGAAAAAGDFEDGMRFVLSKDYARAVQSFRKAAEDGNADAQFNLGVMYSKGRGVEQDFARAAHWYRKAAEQEDVPAQSMMGFMHLKGQGVPQDYQQALFWYLRAAGHGYAVAQHNLGVMYAKGQGVPQDYQQAVSWYISRRAGACPCAGDSGLHVSERPGSSTGLPAGPFLVSSRSRARVRRRPA